MHLERFLTAEPMSEWAEAQAEEEDEFAYSSDERPFANQDDDDDVDWEDVDGDGGDGDGDGQAQDHDATEESDPEQQDGAGQVDWQALNASLERVNKRKRRPAVRRMTKEEKQREVALHQSHLLLLLAEQTKWNRVCQQSALLRGLLLSLTAGSNAAVDFYNAFQSNSSSETMTYLMELLVRWFNEGFRLGTAPTEAQDERVVSESRLMQVFYARQGSHLELTLLFVMLCRALRVRCRLTCALDPLLVHHTKAFEAISTQGGISPGNRKRRRRTSVQDTGNETSVVSSEPIWTWCEVFDAKHSSWLHVDPMRRLVNHTEQVEVQRGKGAPVAYVMSIDEYGHWMDVTARYAEKWSKTIKLRLVHDWIQRCLSQLNFVSAASASEKRNAEAIRELEAQQLQVKTEREEFPTSLEGFKKHHLYCLERHLARNECIYPRKPVGLLNGHAVFLVKDKQVLLPARKWQRLGRVIKPDEQSKPAKRRTDGKAKCQNDDNDVEDEQKSSSTQDGESTDPNAALYGRWQTTEFIPESVVDGRVPKNQYGNIELWSEAHIPRGAVHLKLPRIDTLARDLGVDFAPAVIGFEVKNGKTYPKMDGIVVNASAQELLLDAHAHLQQTTIEQAIAKNQKIVLKRWEKLTKRLLLQNRLNEDYGHTKAMG